MMFISVDLPEPDGPMIATYSLRRMSSETPRSAWIRLRRPSRYSRVRSRMRMTIAHDFGRPSSFLVVRLRCTRAPSLRSRMAW